MKATPDIISFDLFSSPSHPLDISSFFPVSELHAIRSTKPLLDSILPEKGYIIDVSLPRILSISPLENYDFLDIAEEKIAAKRGLSSFEDSYATISVCPPLFPPYGALDVRGESIVSGERYGDIFRRDLPWSLHARRMRQQTSRYLRKNRKPILLSVGLLFLLTVPVLFYTKSLIEGAYADLLSVRETKNQTEIINLIHTSRGNFERANLLFAPFRFLPGENIRLARIALDGGLSLTRGLDTVAADISNSGSGKMIENSDNPNDSLYRPTAKDIRPLAALGIDEPTTWIRKHRSSLKYLSDSLHQAGDIYADAGNLDHPRASEIAHIGRGLQKFSGVLDIYFTHESDILALLGSDMPERYIVFNQNRDEIRANGGFPGTVITFTVFRGNIEDFRTDDVYYYDWNLYPRKELPPPGIALLSNNYGLRDVNYYPDFRDTLEKANTFIERSGDPTVTVGIALHQGLVEDMLHVIGPVSLSGVTDTFREDNFSLLMSLLVESRYGEETSAKDILRKFVDAFVSKIHEKRAYEEVITLAENSLHNGEILLASRNEQIDTFFSTIRKPLPWQNRFHTGDTTSGEISGTGISGSSSQRKNWAYPLLTSLSGNKSDRIMERTYLADTTNIGSCTYMNKLTFTHKHLFSKETETEIRTYLARIGIRDLPSIEKLLAIEGKSKNVTYMRILVPENATLTGSTAGITMSDVPNAREFAFTLETPVGGTASKILRYTVTLPGCGGAGFPISWYRQPGLSRTSMMSR